MRIIGIVGSEAAKFTAHSEAVARRMIGLLLDYDDVLAVSSGHCHLGGIDLWAEEVARELGKFDERYIFEPRQRTWSGSYGYKQRNLDIAAASTEVHCITVRTLPEGYSGMRFPLCYHCKTDAHVKSGGCWTVHQARRMGKPGLIHVIDQ